jgi:16S rRNA (cytosine1402-N4)-methyltransferase
MRDSSRISGSEALHAPVLAAEVVDMIRPRPNGVYVDCTLGLGGHTAALIAAGAGRILAIDRDESAIALARDRLGETGGRVEAVHADFRDLPHLLADRGVMLVDGIVVDLGVSSMQLDDPSRGFSFRSAGPLDMRMDRSSGPSLADKLADVDETTLVDVIWRYGEERRSRRVAKAMLTARDRGALTDTAALASIVRRAVGGPRQRIDPATRTFQALRIWVNDEASGLDAFLGAAADRLSPGGRLAVIAFHSLEDRVVKHEFRRLASERAELSVVTRRPVIASDAERAANPRARSARLRVLERAA